MRLALGSWVLERRTGRPYFVRSYRLEPVAWVLRGARGRVMVRMDGKARGRAWTAARIRPAGVRVTEPGGRQRYLRIPRHSVWSVLAGAAVVVIVMLLLGRRRRKDD